MRLMTKEAILYSAVVICLKIVRGQPDDDEDESVGYQMPSRVKTPQIVSLDATCDAGGMQITVQFDSIFNGIVYSKGSYYTQGCVFIQANNNLNKFAFTIPINACGTQSGNDDTKRPPVRYIENTIVFQNDAMIQQLTDAARKVRCNWNSNFRNTITFTPFRVDIGQITSVSFNGNDVSTTMSVQVGRGPFAPVIAEGLVQIGDTLTLVIYLQTKDVKMEIQVLDCYATDGKNRNQIQLTDENGCVTKEKLISAWQTTRETQNTAAQIAYAYLTAFKFPDDYIVNIKCNIAVCSGHCPVNACVGKTYGQVAVPPPTAEDSYKLHRRLLTTTPVPDDGYGPRKTTPTTPTRRTTTTTTTKAPTTAPRVKPIYGLVEETTENVPPYGPPRPRTAPPTEPPYYPRPRTTEPTESPYHPRPRTTEPTEPPYNPRPRATEPTESPYYLRPTTARRRTVFDRKRRALEDPAAPSAISDQIPLSSSIRVISPSDVNSPNSSLQRLSNQTPDSSTLCVNTVLFAFGVALIFALLVASCVTSALLCVRQRAISKKEKECFDYDSSPLPDYPQK